MSPQYNDNLAYDLSLFEEKKEPVNTEPTRETVVQSARASRTWIKTMKIVVAVAICAFLAGSVLYSNAVLAELNSENVVLQKQLDNLRDEEARLQVELDSRVGMKNIDEYITKELGMTKIEKNQIAYVNLSDGDMMEVSQTPQEGFLDMIKNFFKSAVEHFR